MAAIIMPCMMNVAPRVHSRPIHASRAPKRSFCPARVPLRHSCYRMAAGPSGGAGGGAVSPDLVTAIVPEQILQEDEVVLLLIKPSLWFILNSSVLFLAVTMMLGVLGVQLVRLDSTAYLT